MTNDDDGATGGGPEEPSDVASQSSDTTTTRADDVPGYLTLQPLTLDFVVRQLERLPYKFSVEDGRVVMGWPAFVIFISVSGGSVLLIRARFRLGYLSSELTSFVGRCNAWNAQQSFVKGSASIGVATPTDSNPTAYTQVFADHEEPYRAGIAPVQLQSLIRLVLENVSDFQKALGISTPEHPAPSDPPAAPGPTEGQVAPAAPDPPPAQDLADEQVPPEP